MNSAAYIDNGLETIRVKYACSLFVKIKLKIFSRFIKNAFFKLGS